MLRTTHQRKAQMEIMGLVLIVILIVLGLLFAVQFSLFDRPDTYREEFITSQLSSNTLNTLLSTNVGTNECRGLSIRELLLDNGRIQCSPGVTSNQFVKTKIDFLLIKFLAGQGYDYHFSAKSSSGVDITACSPPQTGSCAEQLDRERERTTQPLPGMRVTLDIYR